MTAVRVVTGVVQDEWHNVRVLFGDGDWSPVRTHEAAAAIAAGTARYVAQGVDGTAPLHPFKGSWVRTASDASTADNLDSLVGAHTEALAAGDCSLVLTLSPAGVASLAREIHAHGAVVTRVSLPHEGWTVTATLGVPTLRPGDGEGTFVIEREALCVATPSDDAAAPAVTAVLVVTVDCAATFSVPRGVGTLDAQLTYSPRPVGTVRLLTPLPASSAAIVTGALLAWATRERTDVWSLPLTGPLAGASTVAARFAPSGHVQLGIDTEGKGARRLPDPRSPWDWTLALSRTVVAAQVADALRAALGGLPRPLGTDGRVAVPGTPDVYLHSLELGLGAGEAVLRGVAYRDAVPLVTANFAMRLSVALADDGDVAVAVEGIDVDVVEWYAKIADFFSGGAIVDAVRAGLEAGLGRLGGGVGLLDADVLTRIVAAGTSGVASVRAVPQHVWIEQGALVVGGSIERSPQAPLPRPVAVGDRLDGTLSETPGADATVVRWTVDGVVVEGRYERRALSFTAPAGWATATLTLTTDAGLTATSPVTRPSPP